MNLVEKIQKHGIAGSFRIVQNVLCTPIRPLFYSLFRLLSIDDKLIIFESQPDFCDNAWALYQYLKETHSYRFVWVVVNPKSYGKSNDTIFISRYGSGLRLKAYWFYSRAKYIIYTHCTLPEFVKHGEQVLVYTSHGCAIKAGKGSGTVGFDFTLSIGKNAILPQSKFLQCDENRVIPIGYPRNDLLLGNKGEGGCNPFATGCNKKVLLWMPTFRKSVQDSLSEQSCDTETGLPLIAMEDDVKELNKFLSENSVEIIVKIHHLQSDKPIFCKTYSNIVFVTDDDLRGRGIQLYEMIGKSDALITDYSSVSFDYLLLDKPIAYILDDMDSYQDDRGFVWDNILDVMPGNHIFDKQQLFDFISEIKNGIDSFAMERAKVKDFIYGSVGDDGSCKRIESYFLK